MPHNIDPQILNEIVADIESARTKIEASIGATFRLRVLFEMILLELREEQQSAPSGSLPGRPAES